MKTIGLIGGMSWESTAHYYRLLNEAVKRRLGGLHSASLVLWSVDFAPIERMQAEARWDDAGRVLAEAARAVERAGAELLLLATNTMHRVAPAIEAAVKIPLLHIAAPTAERIRARGIGRVGLLATRYTMEQAFYRERLDGLDVRVPDERDRERVQRIIYDELCVGRLEPSSRREMARIAGALVDGGAEGVIFGCTEIGMLLGAADVAVPTFDTTALHASAAVAWACGE